MRSRRLVRTARSDGTHLARRHFMETAPHPAQLSRRSKASAFGYRIYVKPRARQHFSRQRDAHATHIVGDAHAGVFVEESGEIARTCRRNRGQPIYRPVPGGVRGDGVLRTMDCRVNVVPPLQPWRKLWIARAPAQVDDQVARD